MVGTDFEIGVDEHVDEEVDEGAGQDAAWQRPDGGVRGYNPLGVRLLLGVFRILEYSAQTSACSSDQGILRSEVTTATSQLYSQLYKPICPFCVLRYL